MKTVHGDLTSEAGAAKPYEQVAAEKQMFIDKYAAVCKALGYDQHWMQSTEEVCVRARQGRFNLFAHLFARWFKPDGPCIECGENFTRGQICFPCIESRMG